MSRALLVETVESGRILVSDGAWGTFLQEKGLKVGDCPEIWNLERADDVLEVASLYIEAGADMVQTNSFGGSSIKLDSYNLASRAKEINHKAAALSRRAAGEDRWVIASMGPTGKLLIMGSVTEAEMYQSFRAQAEALAAGGADALCVETMSDVAEAAQAVKAARDGTSCEVICTFTFERTAAGDYRTLFGVSPPDATRAALEAGADIVGANCGNGFAQMIDVVGQIQAAAAGKPILVHANAGIPQIVGGETVFPDTPEQMAALVPDLVGAGAGIIGGCCGTTPAHIRAIRHAVDRL
jgi:5-methyltetrahydrofolate--homocysteine methyltransferase